MTVVDHAGAKWYTVVDMRGPVLRVSVRAAAELKRRAVEEGRTVVSVLDRVLGLAGEASPRAPVAEAPPGRTAVEEPVPVARVERCVCGHSLALHLQKGETGRCQHIACVPNGCRGFQAAP